MSEEYRVRVTVRNNLILNAIEDTGYTNLAQFAKDNKISLGRLYNLINLREAPLLQSGEFSAFANELMEVLGACPTDLWSAEQLNMKLHKNSGERVLGREALIEALAMNSRAAIELAEDKIDREDLERLVSDNLDTLTPKESKLVKLRFGIDCNEHTLEQIAVIFKVTRERVRQMEAKALRKLRTPERARKLQEFI